MPKTPALDPDAQAFITAAAITDPTQQAAINTLVVDLKGYYIWTKMQAIYPMVGGTASTHKFNLKDPRDLDAAFRLVFSGGWTHSSTGATPNGTNGIADTKLNASTNTTQNDTHISFYSRTSSSSALVPTMASSGYAVTGGTRLTLNYANSCYFGVNTLYQDNVSNNNTQGYFIIRRISSTQHSVMIRGTRTDINQNSDVVVNQTYRIGGSPSGHYDNKECCFATIGNGLNNTELSNLHTAVQAFQTTLGRSIGTQTVSDADAQAFVTNAGIVDQVEANAINNLVIGLKADGLWTKMQALYPFVGGTSTSTSYNLKNTAQYQITWAGGVTHASTGVTFNGTNGYGNTNFAPNSVLTANNNHVSIYSRTSAARTNGLAFDFGQGADLNIQSGIFGTCRRSSNVAYYGATNATTNGSFTVANTNGSGLFTNSITSATSRKINRNGSVLGSLTTNISQTLSAAKMYIAAFNNNDASVLLYSNFEAAFFSIGDGLDDTEATNLNTRVTTFQTSLNRNI
jgi:hypothetical protein